jgi:Secretion system C-terminal sorting domain
MKKLLTNLFSANLMLGTVVATAQTQIWPTTDTNTIKASQFNGANTLFTLTRTNPVVPIAHTGWYTKGLMSANVAKADSAVWQWSAAGKSRGAYGGETNILSPTTANGCAIFDSDWLDNKGIANASGLGQAPVINSGELVSPLMDVRGYDNITLNFNQYYRNYLSATYVSWSEDSGKTWKPRIQLNNNTITNTATLSTDVANIKLLGSVGTSGFRVKFIFEGNYYYWMVDDVKLVTVNYDLKIMPYFAVAPSYVTPKHQVEDMKFLVNIANLGHSMPNVKAKIFVYRVDAASDKVALIYTDSLLYGTVEQDAMMENKIFPGKLLASSLTTGQYYARYRVAGDIADQVPANDTMGFGFFISDSTFSKESGSITMTRPVDNFWTPEESHHWRIGNYYYIKTGFGHTVTALTARLGDLSLLKGQHINANLYEWVDANSDKIVQSDERILVAYTDTIIPPTQPAGNTWMRFALKDYNTLKWFYPKNDKEYLAMIEFDPINTPSNLLVGFNKGVHDYTATIYMNDSLSRAGESHFKPRYVPILGKKSDSDWTTVGFGYGLLPTVRLNLVPFILKDETLTIDHKMELFPNPARETVTLSVDLPHAIVGMMVQILDNEGRMLQEQIFNAVQKDNLTLNLENLGTGTYMLRILTPDGVRTKKLMIAK